MTYPDETPIDTDDEMPIDTDEEQPALDATSAERSDANEADVIEQSIAVPLGDEDFDR